MVFMNGLLYVPVDVGYYNDMNDSWTSSFYSISPEDTTNPTLIAGELPLLHSFTVDPQTNTIYCLSKSDAGKNYIARLDAKSGHLKTFYSLPSDWPDGQIDDVRIARMLSGS